MLQKYWLIAPLVFSSFAAAESADVAEALKGSVFHFSTQVSRTVEKDLMHAEIFSRKTGKNLSSLRQAVSAHLNQAVEQAKAAGNIEINAEGISNYANYDNKGKVNGWVAEGRVQLKSRNFEALGKVLENLGEEVAVSHVEFGLSPEKMAGLEDEITVEIVKQFQHKAELIRQGLGAKSFIISSVQIATPNSVHHDYAPRMYAEMASSKASPEPMPLEASKQTVSATASGQVRFEP